MGLPARASSAGALDGECVDARPDRQDKKLIAAWMSIATVEDLPTVAPATGAPAGSPAKAGRSSPGSDFSDCRPEGPPAIAESAPSRRAHPTHVERADGRLQPKTTSAPRSQRRSRKSSQRRACSTPTNRTPLRRSALPVSATPGYSAARLKMGSVRWRLACLLACVCALVSLRVEAQPQPPRLQLDTEALQIPAPAADAPPTTEAAPATEAATPAAAVTPTTADGLAVVPGTPR